jgi:hypothetical protein
MSLIFVNPFFGYIMRTGGHHLCSGVVVMGQAAMGYLG